ncbi:MAG: AmmeMemoRadiSam system protein B [Armatimonadetes bacterium]|nr:AmmeMemoRadiSam system protein B [Armatimonadota bacterium]
MQVRRPAVADMFYAGNAASLRDQVEGCFTGPLGPGLIPEVRQAPLKGLSGLVVPHAGLMYSGYAAAHAYAALAACGTPDLAVLIGPNHTGCGEPVAVMAEGIWQTPLGDVEIDEVAARSLLEGCGLVADSPLAHRSEHSLEVQIPFLQYLYGNTFKILPLALGIYPGSGEAWPAARQIGDALAEAVRGRRAVLVASTDFTHYESKARAAALDRYALDAIEKMDPVGLLDAVSHHSITMCGALPTSAVMAACLKLGASSARFLTYYCSGDILGDTREVVAYGAFTLQ